MQKTMPRRAFPFPNLFPPYHIFPKPGVSTCCWKWPPKCRYYRTMLKVLSLVRRCKVRWEMLLEKTVDSDAFSIAHLELSQSHLIEWFGTAAMKIAKNWYWFCCIAKHLWYSEAR